MAFAPKFILASSSVVFCPVSHMALGMAMSICLSVHILGLLDGFPFSPKTLVIPLTMKYLELMGGFP